MVDTLVDTSQLPHGVHDLSGSIPPPLRRFRRSPRGSLQLVGQNLALFSWIYHSRLATRRQLTVALRGRAVSNDRYIARALRKLFDHGYVSKLPTHPFSPDVYCVSGKCSNGRRAARSLFGDDSKIIITPSRRINGELAHALDVTWLRVLVARSSQAMGWEAEFLDHQAITQVSPGLPLIPDAAVILDRGNAEGRRLFLFEYQRWDTARKTTAQKVSSYQEWLDHYERTFSSERSWVVVVIDRPEIWVRQLVRALEAQGVRGTFFFGSRERVLAGPPDRLWCDPLFYMPGEEGACSLFRVGEEHGGSVGA